MLMPPALLRATRLISHSAFRICRASDMGSVPLPPATAYRAASISRNEFRNLGDAGRNPRHQTQCCGLRASICGIAHRVRRIFCESWKKPIGFELAPSFAEAGPIYASIELTMTELAIAVARIAHDRAETDEAFPRCGQIWGESTEAALRVARTAPCCRPFKLLRPLQLGLASLRRLTTADCSKIARR